MIRFFITALRFLPSDSIRIWTYSKLARIERRIIRLEF